MCSLSRSLDFDGARTALYLIPVGTDMVLLVAGCLSANRWLPVRIFEEFQPHNQISRSSACGDVRPVLT